ncbi:transposase [Billgrantia sulfidoxydans]|uniref:Transposase n=1 Tax=Billgrantia sulfidoxydans TaxID=2733484 RepID=A0ABX7W2R1_9GAMM|nr:Mu transposase C-terminal domain-containing protein [Halomonas sulfidoxydans]QTP54634.1 transposase [Halomonas sulfidoxydans]
MDDYGHDLGLDLFEDEFIEPCKPETKSAAAKHSHNDAFFREICVPESSDGGGRPLDTYPDKLRDEALRRLTYIQYFKKRISGGWTEKNLKPLLGGAEILQTLDGPVPSWRTLAGWHSAYKNNGFSVEALIPKHHKKGNRKNKMEDDGHYFWRAMSEKYMRKERPSIRFAYVYYCDLINLANRGVISGKLNPMSQTAFYHRVSNIPPYDVDLARYGKRYADRKYKPVGAHVQPTRVLERVEVDHTALDLMLLDDELLVVLGRPYITALIDSYSKCLVGFYIGYKEPGYDSVRKALINAMLSKGYVKKTYPMVNCDWPCEGKIEALVVDNGAEFWSKSLELACQSVVSDIQYNPVGRPWLKPLVERFFGQINQNFLISMPGKTFSGIDQLEDYNPEKDAVMRFSTFMELFHKWVVDVYHQDSNSRKDSVPIISWEQGVKEFPPIIYRDDDEFRVKMELAPTIDRVLGKDGVRFACLRYSSVELDAVRKLTPNSGKSRGVKVKVKIDPDDLSKLYVYLPGEDGYVIANAVDPDDYTVGLSLFQHQTNRRFQRRFIHSQVDRVGLSESRLYIEGRIRDEVELLKSGPKNKKSVSGMKKLARYKNIGSDGASSVCSENESNAKKIPEENVSENNGSSSNSILDEWESNVSGWDPY